MNAPDSGAGGFARFAQLAKNHPVVVLASVLGSIGTFVVSMAGVAGLFMGGGAVGIAEPIDNSSLSAAPSYEYVEVSDATDQITVEVPTVWADVLTNGWHAHALPGIPENEVIGPGLNAAPNVDTWKNDLTTPGVFVGASQEILQDREYSPRAILRDVRFTASGCQKTAGDAYTNGEFTGDIVTWTCPGGAEWRVLAATPTESRSYLVYLQIKLVTSADVEAYNKIINTFEVDFGP